MSNNVDNSLIEKVTSLLMSYKDLKLQAQQLNFEIENYVPMASDKDLIEAMTFGKPSDAGGTHIHNSLVSDKTARIAIAFEQRLRTFNTKSKEELENDLRLVNMEMMRLEYYMDLLGGNMAAVLRLLFIDGKTYIKAAEAMKLSVTSIRNLRKLGIQKLAGMFKSISV